MSATIRAALNLQQVTNAELLQRLNELQEALIGIETAWESGVGRQEAIKAAEAVMRGK